MSIKTTVNSYHSSVLLTRIQKYNIIMSLSDSYFVKDVYRKGMPWIWGNDYRFAGKPKK